MKIGICDRGNDAWTSGREYTRAQAAALLAASSPDAPELAVISSRGDLDFRVAGSVLPVVSPPKEAPHGLVLRGLDHLRHQTGLRPVSHLKEWRRWAEAQGLDLLLTFSPAWWWRQSNTAICCWIPDYQHRHLPDMFSDSDREVREMAFNNLSSACDLMVLSCDAVLRDFKRFAPQYADKARVYRFPSHFAFDPSDLPVPETSSLDRFGIEPDFLLVVNQFWRHKNHEAVIEAASILKRAGRPCPQIVMIGQPTDSRDPSGHYVSGILGSIAQQRLEGRVKMLGFVPGEMRDALFRCCKALVQPSRSEGWNTSIEDAKALGLSLIHI